MFQAPPPAALEFLTKIREVIAIAKHKMAAKRFLPSLLGIPEENENDAANTNFGSRNNIIQKKSRQKRYTCEGCPGCIFMQSDSLLKEKSYLPCCDASNENKHQSIQKWLEDVTVSKPINPSDHEETVSSEINEKEKIFNMQSKSVCHKVSNSKRNDDEINNFSEQEVKGYNILSTMQPNIGSTCSAEFSDTICEEILRKITDCSNEIAIQTKKTFHRIDHNENESDSEDITEQNTINKMCSSSPPPPPPPSTCSSLSSKHVLERQESTTKELIVPKIAKKLMDAVIKEFVDQRAQEYKSDYIEQSEMNKVQGDILQSLEYDSDSLERILAKKDDEGMRTPSDYGDVLEKSNDNTEKQAEIDGTLEDNVQIDSSVNTIEQKVDLGKESKQILDDHEYEVISLNPENINNKFILPDILSRGEGYSLVSEVYVNDSYSFSSTSSLPSNHSSSASNEPKIKYATENPGQLTIEVEDSPSNYEKSYDSDNFEPDTLDRKPSKLKINGDNNFEYNINRDSFSDSLERPTHISLRTTGSFRSDSLSWYEASRFSNNVGFSPLTRTFGSLREIFEARNRHNPNTNRSETLSPVCSTRSLDTDCYSTLSWKRGKPKFLRPDPRQARRQRQPSPPDSAPPRPPKTIYSNEYILQNMLNYRSSVSPPLPPRSIKPPLPPKNGLVRSTSQQSVGKKQNCRVLTNLPTSSLMTRGILAGASGNSPPSSDYETIDNQQNQCDYKKNVSLSKNVNSSHKPQGRNNTIILRNPRDKSFLNYHDKVQFKMSVVPHRTEDSGYLSSDSAGSESKRRDESLSETDDSLCDGASESGAESIATDSFFFGNFHKLSVSNSADNGMCTGAASVHSDSDSNISFVTVLPTGVCKKQ